MRGYTTISDEEKNSILQRHSSFYNGFAVGNVPNEPQPLRVGKGASDPNGITVDNKGNVKTYQNHKINESVVSEDVNENEDILKNYKALIGFVQFIIDKGGENKSIEEASALSELSIYYENLRDGITPKTLSKGGQVVRNIVERDIMKFNDAQIKNFEKNNGGENEDILKNYKALIGFVQFIIDKGGENKSIEEASALSELSIYYENLRDGITPKTLSKEAQISKQIVEKDIIKFNDAQIKKFEKNGGGETRLYEMDMDISDEESAYSFKSDGPEQFDSSYSDDSYGLDIDSIMQMFGDEMSPADVDMDFNDDETDEFEGYFEDSVEGDPYDYIENGGFMDEQVESETCEQCGSEMSEGECMECGSMYEEIDDELHESFKENTKVIKEMFNRFSKFN